jgi:hypothetical protein
MFRILGEKPQTRGGEMAGNSGFEKGETLWKK